MIPTVTMCTFMDLPRHDQAQFLKWNLDTLGGADFTSVEALAAYGAMDQYWQGVVAERKANPGSDVISQIIHAQVEGAELSDVEISGFCSLLHDASQNTTMNMITNAVISLARFPDERRRLRDDPSLWTRAFEEMLRYVSPVQGLARAVTRDVTLHGVTIPEGDQVLVLYGAANHDPAIYPDPERFDIDRKAKAHWSFGHGIHYCLGNAVARLEAKIALQVLVDRLGEWEIDESRVERNQLVPTRGVAHAPVEFAPVTEGRAPTRDELEEHRWQ
jgi:cytochrome P450